MRTAAARLARALASEEIPQVLAWAIVAMDEASKTRFFAGVGAETSSVLLAALAEPAAGKPSSTRRRHNLSSARIRQEWQAAWARWEDCIGEATSEEGRYVTQDDPWEPPYLNLGSLSDDLDEAVGAIRPLLERVLADDLDPGFRFADRLVAAAEEIGSGLPEWMDGPAEEFGFGPEVTRCLLESESAAARRSGDSAYAFARRIAQLEAGPPVVPLDGAAIACFIQALGRSEKAEIQRGISADRDHEPWLALLSSARNHWGGILKKLSKRVGAAASKLR